jgi:hypothetical protein
LLGGVGARLEAGTAVAKTLPAAAAQRSRQAVQGVLAQRPRWASWNVDELNAGRDGWNEPGAWLSRILNWRRLGQQYENFPNTSNARHHWGMVAHLADTCCSSQATVFAGRRR